MILVVGSNKGGLRKNHPRNQFGRCAVAKTLENLLG